MKLWVGNMFSQVSVSHSVEGQVGMPGPFQGGGGKGGYGWSQVPSADWVCQVNLPR